MRDFLFADHGSIVAIVPPTKTAMEWLDDNVVCEPRQWLGNALCVDPRCARDLKDTIAAELIGPIDLDMQPRAGVEPSGHPVLMESFLK